MALIGPIRHFGFFFIRAFNLEPIIGPITLDIVCQDGAIDRRTFISAQDHVLVVAMTPCAPEHGHDAEEPLG
jgi:hypothetical protein